jgi:KUP system potassium uptake protein
MNSPSAAGVLAPSVTPAPSQPPLHVPRAGLAALTVGALGVVYGDIGTSPLYTMHEVFQPATGVPANEANIVGAVSAILWALMIVVTLKYVVLILRADNRGEGGGLALTALASSAERSRPRLRQGLLLLGVFGATLFYGDSVITPAISVLGAVEGMEAVSPALQTWVLPVSLAVLGVLFLVQRFGTHVVGRMFGPVLGLWFVVIGIVGAIHVAHHPAILAALNPWRAAQFLVDRGWHVFAAVGAIVLALTGAEALYADMGHFGRRPIQIAWSGLVMPALALNYLGQGAILMSDPSAVENPFFHLFPDAARMPAVVLATLAAIIASQAVISGAYSMTKQAIQLGFLPRMTIRNTSAKEAGQIYVPAVNWLLLVGVGAATIGFGSSSALAGAYGIAVTVTMFITTVLMFFVVRHLWRVPTPLAVACVAPFLVVDGLLVASCSTKLLEGGWFPLAMGFLIFAIMSTWARGRKLLVQAIAQDGLELEPFLATLEPDSLPRVERTAVYAVADPGHVPQALLHNLKHYRVLHERNVILTVSIEEDAYVPAAERVEVRELGHGFWRVTLHFGFMQTPDVPRGLALCEERGLQIPVFETSYFLSRSTVVPTAGTGMANWRERLFAAMTRNATSVVEWFRLPDNAVVELGTRVQI